MTQLAAAHHRKSDKETLFLQQVQNIGGMLPIPLEKLPLETTGKTHVCLEIKAMAEHIFSAYPQKLMAGCSSMDDLGSKLDSFWSAYRTLYRDHPVFRDHAGELCKCLPVKIHSDEGTGLRKTAIYQFSWGPLLSSSQASWDRYFFWGCMPHEDYKKEHSGFEKGNAVLDEFCSHMARQAAHVYTEGINVPNFGTMYMVWTGHEGDLPAQARAYHLRRNFNCVPNHMCPWCMADDKDVPFSDERQEASWRRTIGAARPWTSAGPFSVVPGGDHEMFLAKDIFHICHLGIVRSFAINLLCYLVAATSSFAT